MDCSLFSPPSTRSLSRWQRWVLCLGLWLLSLPLYATPHRVLLVLSQDAPAYRQFTQSLQGRLPASDWHVQTVLAQQYSAASVEAELILTVGTQASQRVLQQPLHWPVLSVLLPRRSFERISNRPELRKRLVDGRLSTIYLEQPYQRQLHLASLIQPSIRRFGVVLGPSSQDQLDTVKAEILARNWQPRLASFERDQNPIQLLEPLTENSDAILVVPDKSEFNHSISKWLLMLSYRRNIPLIGYSSRYVDAGATAAVFSTPTSVAQDTVLWLQRWRQQPSKLPPPGYPEHCEIRVNAKAGASIGLALPSLEQINDAIIRDKSR